MRFHGINMEQAWRVAFWVVLILAALASAVRAIVV